MNCESSCLTESTSTNGADERLRVGMNVPSKYVRYIRVKEILCKQMQNSSIRGKGYTRYYDTLTITKRYKIQNLPKTKARFPLPELTARVNGPS